MFKVKGVLRLGFYLNVRANEASSKALETGVLTLNKWRENYLVQNTYRAKQLLFLGESDFNGLHLRILT
jgi:hypothetical protein